MANLVIDFMQIFLYQGFAQALIQKQKIEQRQINTVFFIQILISIVNTLILYGFAGIISTSFHQPQLKLVLQVFSFLFIINAFSQTPTALLRRQLAFRALAFRALFAIIIAGIVGVFLALNGYGVWSLVAQQLTYEIVSVICLWKATDWRPKWQFSVDYLPELFSFTISILGSRLVNFFNQRTDNLLIGYFLGDVALGYYAIAHRILQVMTQLLVGTLNQVILPVFARLQEDQAEFVKIFYQATQYTCLITLPTFSATIILGEDLIMTLFGEKWSNAIPIMQILSLTGILRGLTFFQRSAFIALGKPSLQLKVGLLNAILNVIACLVAIQWGILAVAMAYVISDYLVFPLSQWLLTRLINISWREYLSQFMAPVVCTLMMILSITITQQILIPDLIYQWKLFIASLVAIAVYIMSLWWLFPQLWSSILAVINKEGNNQ